MCLKNCDWPQGILIIPLGVPHWQTKPDANLASVQAICKPKESVGTWISQTDALHRDNGSHAWTLCTISDDSLMFSHVLSLPNTPCRQIFLCMPSLGQVLVNMYWSISWNRYTYRYTYTYTRSKVAPSMGYLGCKEHLGIDLQLQSHLGPEKRIGPKDNHFDDHFP